MTCEKDSPSRVRIAERKVESFLPERNHYFLEFTGAESLTENVTQPDPDWLLWFGDLIRHGLIGSNAVSGTAEEVQDKQAYLHSWGYGTNEGEQETQPFKPNHPGLLTGNLEGGTSDFMRFAQQRAKGLLLLVEPFFAAATFGLAALDFFTTTGARMTELLQFSLSPDCLYTMQVAGTQRMLVRLIPKGQDQPAEYMIGSETRRNKQLVEGSISSKPLHIDPERDVKRARYRYMQQTKQDIVERLLLVEQYYAENQEQLARLQFELAEIQLSQREIARRPGRSVMPEE